MKRILLFSTILLFIISSINGQNKYDSLGYKTGVWVFTELPYDSFLNFEPIVIANYVNDTLQGSYKVLDSNEILRYECSYNKNNKNGIAIGYFANGKVQYAFHYSNGEILSRLSFDTKGRIYELIEFKNGQQHGFYMKFKKNGRLSSKEVYINGIISEEILYYHNGRPDTLFIYQEGRLKDYINYSRRGKVLKK